MKESAKQTCVMIGIALLVLAGIMAYMSLSSPRVYVTPDSSTVPHSEYNDYTAPSDAGKVNINYADIKELSTINGIGDTIAQQIVGYREENGAFSSIDELLNVKGIGESKLSEIAPYITV